MKSLSSDASEQQSRPSRSTKQRFIALTVLFSIFVLSYAILRQPSRASIPPDGVATETNTAQTSVSAPQASLQQDTSVEISEQSKKSPKVRPQAKILQTAAASQQQRPTIHPTPRRPSAPKHDSTFSEQIIKRLARFNHTHEALTPRQADDIRRGLQQLVAQGSTAAPAIQEFLQSFKDVSFRDRKGGARLEYGTLRLAMIATLGQIGGPEVEQILLDELQVTAEPVEIKILADMLERQAPGVHREAILSATQETLAVLSDFPLHAERTDTSPLFGVLQLYGDAMVADELERSPSWFKPSAIVTLAHLPENQGVENLISMVQNPAALESEQGRLALQMLTQIAADNPEAKEALLDQVRLDLIPESLWPRLGKVAAGRYQAQMTPPNDNASLGLSDSTLGQHSYSTHTIVGRQIQTIYQVNAVPALSLETWQRRLELIDQLNAETLNPVAIAALGHARDLLMERGHSF